MDPKFVDKMHTANFWLDLTMKAHMERRGNVLHVFAAYHCTPSVMVVDLNIERDGLPKMIGEPRFLGDAKNCDEAESLVRAEMNRIDSGNLSSQVHDARRKRG